MPNAIRDASLTTARRRQLATFVWRASNTQPILSEQRPSYGFQGLGPSAQIPVDVKLGASLIGQQTDSNGCACGPGFTFAGYDKKAPGC